MSWVVAVLRLINRVRSLLIHDIHEKQKTNSFRKNSIGTHKQSSQKTYEKTYENYEELRTPYE